MFRHIPVNASDIQKVVKCHVNTSWKKKRKNELITVNNDILGQVQVEAQPLKILYSVCPSYLCCRVRTCSAVRSCHYLEYGVRIFDIAPSDNLKDKAGNILCFSQQQANPWKDQNRATKLTSVTLRLFLCEIKTLKTTSFGSFLKGSEKEMDRHIDGFGLFMGVVPIESNTSLIFYIFDQSACSFTHDLVSLELC